MMIPFKVKTFSFLLACACSTAGMAQVVNDSPVRQVKISGYVGTRIADCIERRVKAQDVDHLVEPFRHQNEKSRWQSEFWGKWIQGAIASYRYNRDPELYRIIKDAAESLMATQQPNGYIGNYAPEYQLQQWDVWGRKHTSLGLIAWYDLSGDKSIGGGLQSCRSSDDTGRARKGISSRPVIISVCRARPFSNLSCICITDEKRNVILILPNTLSDSGRRLAVRS